MIKRSLNWEIKIGDYIAFLDGGIITQIIPYLKAGIIKFPEFYEGINL